MGIGDCDRRQRNEGRMSCLFNLSTSEFSQSHYRHMGETSLAIVAWIFLIGVIFIVVGIFLRSKVPALFWVLVIVGLMLWFFGIPLYVFWPRNT